MSSASSSFQICVARGTASLHHPCLQKQRRAGFLPASGVRTGGVITVHTSPAGGPTHQGPAFLTRRRLCQVQAGGQDSNLHPDAPRGACTIRPQAPQEALSRLIGLRLPVSPPPA